jgi:hypothetical protein
MDGCGNDGSSRGEMEEASSDNNGSRETHDCCKGKNVGECLR